MQTNPLDNARPIDIWIWSNKPEIRKTAEYIFTQLQKKLGPRLQRKFHLLRLKNHLKVILTDLLVVRREDPHRYLSFSRQNADYVPCGRYKKIFLNPKYMAFLTDFLAAEKFIELHKGFYFDGYSRISRMKATPKLLRYFRKNREQEKGIILSRKPGILMRDRKKREIDFNTDTLEVKKMLRNVWKINKHLKEHVISLDTSKIPEKLLREYMPFISDKHSKYIRIFNNNDFNQGGRFYSHWSQFLPKELRNFILIDGKETIELDYSCLHLTLIYAINGIESPAGDLYKIDGISTEHRGIIKKAFNIAINSNNKKSAILAINESRKEIEVERGILSPKANDILSGLESTHPILSEYLCSGYGVHLQNIDSSLAESIMLDLLSKNICVLTIHDSFRVDLEYKDILFESMKNNFYHRFNFYPVIK